MNKEDEIEDLIEVEASSFLRVDVTCPHCKEEQDVLDKFTESFSTMGSLELDECEKEIVCRNCKKRFLITKVYYNW